MISKLSAKLTEKMLSSGAISDEDKELYIYGLFMLLSQIMFFIITCILGVILNCTLESVLFYIAFQFIRKYAGGYHASTETRCEIMSTLSILACIVVIRLSKTYAFQTVLLAVSAAAAGCISVLCPLDTPEKPLSESEFKYFRKISLIILFVIIAVITVSYIFRFKAMLVPCCMSLILEAVLISAGKIKKYYTAKQTE